VSAADPLRDCAVEVDQPGDERPGASQQVAARRLAADRRSLHDVNSRADLDAFD